MNILTHAPSTLRRSPVQAPPTPQILMTGLDGAGKTTLLRKLGLGPIETTIPHIGLAIETVTYQAPWYTFQRQPPIQFTSWDIGGSCKAGTYLPIDALFPSTKAIIAVVDATDRDRLIEASEELHDRIWNEDLRDRNRIVERMNATEREDRNSLIHQVGDRKFLSGVPVLVLVSKMDSEKCIPFDEICEKLKFAEHLHDRSWHIQPCDIKTGLGLRHGFEWLASQTSGQEQKALKFVAGQVASKSCWV